MFVSVVQLWFSMRALGGSLLIERTSTHRLCRDGENHDRDWYVSERCNGFTTRDYIILVGLGV